MKIEITCPKCNKSRPLTSRYVNSKRFVGRCYLCAMASLREENSPHWKGKIYSTKTYKYSRVKLLRSDPFYPMTNKWGVILEHRYIVAKKLGRLLKVWETVHHINGIYTDNRLENLMVVSPGRHSAITLLQRRVRFLENEVERLKNGKHS